MQSDPFVKKYMFLVFTQFHEKNLNIELGLMFKNLLTVVETVNGDDWLCIRMQQHCPQ